MELQKNTKSSMWKNALIAVLSVVALGSAVTLVRAGGAETSFGESLLSLKSELASLREMKSLLDGFFSEEKLPAPKPKLFGASEEPIFGASGATFTTRPIAQVIIVTSTEALPNTASTTLDQGSLQNPSGGVQRLITRLSFFSASSTNTFLGGPLILDFNTTTNAFTSSSRPIYSSTFTTSTNPVLITTSTPNGASPGIWQMIWNPGEYLHCTTNRAVSTTNAFCAVEYVNAQ